MPKEKRNTTRMHSSRMRTVHSSSCLLGGSASMHAGKHSPTGLGLDPHPLGLDPPSQTPTSPWVWAWTPQPHLPTSPLGLGLENPPPARPPPKSPQPPSWVWAWRLPQPDNPNLLPGSGPGESPSQTPNLPTGSGHGDPPALWTEWQTRVKT